MDTKFLRDIGLTDNEIRIYLELLSTEEALASDLADRTDINRTLTYQILKKLLKRGLISYVIKNNTKYFKAGHPDKLVDYLKEKELNVKKMIPDLLTLSKSEGKQHSVEMYEGKEGLKAVLNDALRSRPSEFLDMTSGMTTIILHKYLMDQWWNKMVKAKIRMRLLYNHTRIGEKRAKEVAKYRYSHVRLLPKGFNSPSHIYIYSDRVGIALWEKEFPFAILIKSNEIAYRFKEFFEWFWRLSKPI